MGQRINLSYQVQGILPPANGGVSSSLATLQFADNETPSGVTDGVNSTFLLANAPSPVGSLLFVVKNPGGNGFVLLQTIDYTLAGNVVNTTAPPASGAAIRTWYRYSQFPALFGGELMVMSDTINVVLSNGFQFSDSLSFGPDGLALGLRPVVLKLYDRMILNDAFVMQVKAAQVVSDTMSLSDAFAKTLH
jgi:hypothetical protein